MEGSGTKIHGGAVIKDFSGGIYLDLNAISHAALQSGNRFGEFVFLPHGLLWKVVPAKKPIRMEIWRNETHRAHQRLENYLKRKPAREIAYDGSWEQAAVQIALDAKLQIALFELQSAVALGP